MRDGVHVRIAGTLSVRRQITAQNVVNDEEEKVTASNSTFSASKRPESSARCMFDTLRNQTAVSGSLSNTRTFNTKNQITSQTGFSATPTYDNNGNMTKDENGITGKFDAWNRLVAYNGTAEVWGYDADNRRPSLSVCSHARPAPHGSPHELRRPVGIAASKTTDSTTAWKNVLPMSRRRAGRMMESPRITAFVVALHRIDLTTSEQASK